MLVVKLFNQEGSVYVDIYNKRIVLGGEKIIYFLQKNLLEPGYRALFYIWGRPEAFFAWYCLFADYLLIKP